MQVCTTRFGFLKVQFPLAASSPGQNLPENAVPCYTPGQFPSDECPEAIGDNPIERYLSPTFKG